MWSNVVGQEWYDAAPGMWDSEYMKSLQKWLHSQYLRSDAIIYPEAKNVFRAFRLTPFHNVKVVILGQDPYYDGSATGLAFANKEETIRISSSLQKIKDCVADSCYNGLKVDFDVTLENWAKQGVLLLNTALTVEKGRPGVHSQYWQKLTAGVLTCLTLYRDNLHFCLWGKHAQEYEKWLLGKEGGHQIHKAEHPAYAARQVRDWKCDHFVKLKDVITW